MRALALLMLALPALSCGRVAPPQVKQQAAQPAAQPAPPAAAWRGPKQPVERIVFVLFENEHPAGLPADGFFARIAREGASLQDCHAVARPSQPNYLALVSGDTHGASNDNITLDAPHVGKLLEAKGLSLRCYAEGYPGGCFLDARKGLYARKHVPFLSFADVTSDPARCANIVVPFERFFDDLRAGTLPTYSFLVPDLVSSGHDKGIQRADDWATEHIAPLLADPAFTKDTLLVVTFDEGKGGDESNLIYCAFWGEMVRPGARLLERTDHYSILRTVEALFGLPTMTANDAAAKPIAGIFRE